MATTVKNTNTFTPIKNLWCREAKAKQIIDVLGFNPFRQGKGYHVRDCSYGQDCRGCHSRDEFVVLSHISKWNRIDKSTFNFSEMYTDIIRAIKDDTQKVKDSQGFKNRINNLNELNFVEVLQLWRDLSCYYRKIAKEIKQNNLTGHPSGYTSHKDVPGFFLNEKIEDNAWAMERQTKLCKEHLSLKTKINEGDKVTVWDICLGEMNCKVGVHNFDELLCIDDFLTGTCSCDTLEEHNKKGTILKDEIKQLSNKINFAKKNSEKVKLSQELINKKTAFNCLQRKIHYSDDGMSPFQEQWKAHLDKMELERKAKEEEEAKKERPAWDHTGKLGEVKVGKVIKLSLKK